MAGVRDRSTRVITINVAAAEHLGATFFICEANHVVVTKGIDGILPRETFESVMDLRDDTVVMAHRDPLPLIKSISKLREQEEWNR